MKKIILLSLLALSLNAVSAQTTTVTPGAPFTINNGKDTLLLKLDPGNKGSNKNKWGKPQQLQPLVIVLQQPPSPPADNYFITRNQKTWWLIILSMAMTGVIVALFCKSSNGGCNPHYYCGSGGHGNCGGHGCVHHQGSLTVAGNVKHAGELTQTGNVNHSGVVTHYHYQKTEEPAAPAAQASESVKS